MAVSEAVRAYYAERIFRQSGRGRVPPNFRFPEIASPTGKASVEGCAGGGKNILEVYLLGEGDRVRDVRVSCGLCNPAMYAAADVVCDWARGRTFAEVMAVDPFRVPLLEPLFRALGGAGRPDDAREKFQYALIALQNAVRAHRHETIPPTPKVAEATTADLDDLEPGPA
jgi:hypothetical protein